MAIRSNLNSGIVDFGAASADTVLFVQTNRSTITAFSIFNTTSSDRAVDIYVSPDATSAAGIMVASYVLEGNSSAQILELLGQGIPETNQIIGVQTTGGASSGDLNSDITYTLFTAGS